jgi:hypothetical protein
MYTAIKQAAEQYVEHEYETVIDPQKLDIEHERMHEYALSCAKSMSLEIFELVLKKHPHLRKVFDKIEKDLAWKEYECITVSRH